MRQRWRGNMLEEIEMRLFRIMQQRQGTVDTSTADQVRTAGLCVAVVALPWDMIAPHEKTALRNHGQDLEMLHSRGGLDAGEALAVLNGHSQYTRELTEAGAHAQLYEKLMVWQREENAKAAEARFAKLATCTHHRMTLDCPFCNSERRTAMESL
jgi:hypothetical protein